MTKEQCASESHSQSWWHIACVNVPPVAFTLYLLIVSIPGLRSIIWNQAVVIDGPQEATSQELWSYIINQTPLDTVIVFRKPFALSLYTRRQSHVVIPFEKGQDYSRVEQGYRNNRVSLFITDTAIMSGTDRMEDSLRAFLSHNQIPPIWQNRRFIIYGW